METGIGTTQFQGWITVALLKGLGFTHTRDRVEGDYFSFPAGSGMLVFEGWAWDDVEDAPYLEAYQYQTTDGHTNVMVWFVSSSSPSQRFGVAVICTPKDWERFEARRTEDAWKSLYTYHGIKVQRTQMPRCAVR